jgi:hypothetical protein
MDPTKEKTLEQLLAELGTNEYSYDSDISTAATNDTITLSSNYGNGSYSGLGGPYAFNSNTITSTTLNNGIYNVGAGSGYTNPWATNVSPKIRLDGEGADIEVNGESLIGMIRRIEERLNILTPNQKLEEEWEELRVLGEQYRKLEQHIKDKQATWDKLKAMPPPIID